LDLRQSEKILGQKKRPNSQVSWRRHGDGAIPSCRAEVSWTPTGVNETSGVHVGVNETSGVHAGVNETSGVHAGVRGVMA